MIIPYIDQPLDFWETIAALFPRRIKEVYFPMPHLNIGSGRPEQPSFYLNDFLHQAVLINPLILDQPVAEMAPTVISTLHRLIDNHGLVGATVANPELARRIKEALPHLSITASVLMDVARPQQARQLNDICDQLVPASRIMRDLNALQEIKTAFTGKIRLMVNEACLPDCLFRTQHFFEMRNCTNPASLCAPILDKEPWQRLTGAWVLPQHLHLFNGLYDEIKLAGRVTLQDPAHYQQVVTAYGQGTALPPHQIGGGPASLLHDMEISAEFYTKTLHCDRRCHRCTYCQEYFSHHTSDIHIPV